MKRIPQLDSVRAIAVLCVFFHHALGIKLMWMGVDLFFVLSGFLITNVLIEAKQNTLKGYFAHFYGRRARRILPPYVLTLLLVSLFFGVSWMHHWYFYILLTNLLLPLGITHPPALEPLWSLAVEEQFYLVWPFAVYFLSTRRLRVLAMVLLVASLALRGIVHFAHHWPIYTLTPFRMDLLSAGALLCLIWREQPEWIAERGPRAALLLMGAGLATLVLLGHFGISTYGNSRTGNVLIYEASLAACCGFVLYALSGWHVGWLRIGAIRYIGTISYTMYLVHVTALTLASRWVPQRIAHSLVALALTIAYASLSWFLLERPLLAKRSTNGQTPLRSQPLGAGAVK